MSVRTIAVALALAIALVPAAAVPAMAASDPAQFSFAAGLDGSTVTATSLTVSGTADPATGGIAITGGGECYAAVDETTGNFSCNLTMYESTPALEIRAEYLNDESVYETLGSATVSVILPPELDEVGYDGETPTITANAPTVRLSGRAVPSSGESASTVRAVASTADGDVTCTATTDLEGSFGCELPGSVLAGSYQLSVTQQPYWAGERRSLPAFGGVTLVVAGLEFAIDGESGRVLEQGQSLTLAGSLIGADVAPDTAVTATMAIDGANPTPFECGVVVESNRWECVLATAPRQGGSYTVELSAQVEGGVVARDRSLRVTVIGAPVVVVPPVALAPTVPAPVPVPTATPEAETPEPEAPLDWTVALGGVSGALRPGDSFSISSANLPPGTTVEAEIQSTPIALGSTVVGADGTFTLNTTVPLEIEPGAHTVVVTVTAPGRAPAVSRTPVIIEAGASTPDAASSVAANDKSSASAPSPRNEPGASNGVSDSIQPFWDTLASPVAIGTAVLAGLVFLVLVAFPAEVLTAAIKDRYRFMQRRDGLRAPRRFARTTAWFGAHPLVAGITLLAVATVISGFADPGFGIDLASLRLLIACFIAALIVSYGAYLLTSWIMNRRWSLPTSISLRPYTLIITIIGVVLSRLLDFSPGFLFGLMLGLSFPPATPDALRSRARVVRTSLILGIAVVSWFAYSFVSLGLAAVQPTFASSLLQDTLAALSTEGLTGMLIAMLPFLFLDGHDLWKHSKRLWAGIYAIVVVIFFLVVAPKPENWGDLGEKYGPWALILGCFTAVSVGAYLWLRWDTRRQERLEAKRAADRELLPR